MRKFWLLASFLCAISCAIPAVAQEGHPLVGTWHGSWSPNAKDRRDLTLVLNWDGKNISGMINPGPDSVKFPSGVLDPSNWTVHFEAEGKDSSGKPVRIVIDGKIENITNVRRFITGTWSQGSDKGEFKVTRDN
jgi:hypothetical protein